MLETVCLCGLGTTPRLFGDSSARLLEFPCSPPRLLVYRATNFDSGTDNNAAATVHGKHYPKMEGGGCRDSSQTVATRKYRRQEFNNVNYRVIARLHLL